jgi:hypothetical protein
MTREGTHPRDRHPGVQVLHQRALNRALIERQWLARRREAPAHEAIEHLAGLQAQSPQSPYLALWSRLKDFRPDDASKLLTDRAAVRMTSLRGTVHLLSSRDALTWRPLLQPVVERLFRRGSPFGRAVQGVDEEALLRDGKRFLAEQPRTGPELRRYLAGRWPGFDASSLGSAVLYLVPAVQVPPRGLWRRAGQARWTPLETWLGRPLDAVAVDTMVLRYLGAFGPATVADIQTWCGLSRLREVVERLQPGLRTFRDETGRELFDLPDAALPDPETPVPVRFLPDYDNVLLSHADRSRIASEAARARMRTRNGMVLGTVLVDGFARAAWKLITDRDKATVLVEGLEPLSAADRVAIEKEATSVLDFLAETSSERDVRWESII